MNLLEFKKYCLNKKGAYEDFPFGPEPTVIKVASKIFALINDKFGKFSLSLKCDPFVAQSFREQYSAVTSGYHLNKEHWNTIVLNESVPESEICWMIDHSYDLILKSLKKIEISQLNE